MSLPAQESEEDTYMNLSIFRILIYHNIQPGKGEIETLVFWHNLFPIYFPSDAGYILERDEWPNQQAARYILRQWVFYPPPEQYKFHVFAYNAPGCELQAGVWTHELRQLTRWFKLLAVGHTRRIFGTVAVGKAVRFYEWDRSADRATNMAPDDAFFYIDRQCQTIVRYLRLIRSHSEQSIREFRNGTTVD